nr:MAG TPA: hypothetical protein [Caudoviricetes sp.]
MWSRWCMDTGFCAARTSRGAAAYGCALLAVDASSTKKIAARAAGRRWTGKRIRRRMRNDKSW